MKVELNENIQSISGRLGNLIFTTRMGRDGKPRVFAHRLPAPRRTKPSKREIAGRTRFGAIGRAVQQRKKNLSVVATDVANFKAQQEV